MPAFKLNKETMRTAVAVGKGFGYVFVANLENEAAGDPFTKIVKLKDGQVEIGDTNYDAISACYITDPAIGLVDVAENGYFTANTRAGLRAGDLIDSAKPPSKNRRIGGIRSVTGIGGRAHAVGYGGMLYRHDALGAWSRIDEGLDGEFDIEAIDGFSPADLYLVGNDGSACRLAGNLWQRLDLPINANLNSVKCAPDGLVYAAGTDGTVVRGRDDVWSVLDDSGIEDEVWDLEWFQGRLYASTFDAVFVLDGDRFVPMAIGGETERSCYQLSAGDGVLWSVGERELWQFDGRSWLHLV
jgi:hypothetical protein